jgi:ADP-heptose:LPS heptosyltransferase
VQVSVWEHPAALRGRVIGWGGLRRVLVVRPDNLGDVVMCGPALRALRAAAPQAAVDLLATPAGAAVAPLLPELDDVVVAPSASWQELDPYAVPAGEDLELIRRIAAGRYDAALVLTSFSQSPWPAACLCRLAGVGVRAGMSKEFGGAGLTHWVPSPPDELHQVDRALYLLQRLGVPTLGSQLHLRIPHPATAEAREVLSARGVEPDGRYAVLFPGASCPSRRYPADRFAAVAGILAAHGLPVVVAGTAKESGLVAQVAGVPGAVGLPGVLSVPGAAAAVAGSSVVVCNNSGAAHLADALGTPVVVLFAGTEQMEQYTPRHTYAAVMGIRTGCSPCRQLRCPYEQQCLDLPADAVARQALRLS